MSPRGSVERDARIYARAALESVRKSRRDRNAVELLDDAADILARQAAQDLLAGDVPRARRWARAHQLLAESSARLSARRTRAIEARQAIAAAAHGIPAGAVVRITRASRTGAVGTVVTIDDVAGDILWTTVDGKRCIVWAADVERVDQLERTAVPA